MKVEVGPQGHFVLRVPSVQKEEVATLMAYRGLTFSTSGSSREEAILFSENPYSVCDLAEGVPALASYYQAIQASRALDGKGTRKLPPGKELWPFQRASLDYVLERGGGIVGDQPGLGKRQPLSEPILTPSGWFPNGSLRPGDLVFGANGRPVEVEAVFPAARSKVYRVVFSDGRSVRCDPEHLWEVEQVSGSRHRVEVRTTQSMVDDGLTCRGGTRNGLPRQNSRFYVPLVKPVYFPEIEPDIDPYVLGALIGDGALTGDKIALCTPDLDIFVAQEVERRLTGYHLVENRHAACPRYFISSPDKRRAFHHKIKTLGLNMRSVDRRIPEIYFEASISQRLDLLRGLMDTDGSCIRNRTTFHTKSPGLAEDVAQIVRSLGGWAKVRAYDRTREQKGLEYQVNVRLTQCPFLLPRKAENWKPKTFKLAITEIVEDGYELQRCIKIADPRGLYVTSGYTLTHNTPISIAACNHWEAHRVLVICLASLRLQWEARIKEWSTIPGLKVSTMLNVKDGIHPTAHYQIISYNAATNPAIMRAISKYKWQVLILDEAHALKNTDAIRTRAILGNSKGMFVHGQDEDGKKLEIPAIAKACQRTLALTGTPLLNRPSEAYVMLRHFDWESIDFCSFEKFKERYNRQAVIKTVTGKRHNLESTSLETELQNRLRANIMARHEKVEVMPQLKVPRYQVVQLAPTGAVKAALAEEGLLGIDIDDIRTRPNITVDGHVAEVRRLMGVALAPQVAEYAEDWLDGCDEKLLIFAWHIEVLDILEEKLSRFGTMRIDGSVSATNRQKRVNDFVDNSRVRVAIMNMQSGGTGVDGLQKVCSHCFLAEPDWVPAQNEQAVARLDRIGQENLVTAEIFVAPGSISEKILIKALEKMNTIFRVLDKEGI